MRFLSIRRAVILILLGTCVSAETSLVEKRDGLYATQPKLRVQGVDLPADPSVIDLKFFPEISSEDYTLSVQPTALVLELTSAKQWILLEDNSPPSPLFLTSAKVDGKELLESGGIQVASVYPTPDVQSSDRLIYTTTPPEIYINGTSFNIKHTALFFDPPLTDGEDFSSTVLSSTQIKLVKKYGKSWRKDGPGPLNILAIDTGGGRLGLDPEKGGRIIAEVQADLDGHGVTVETHLERKIYQSTPTLKIDGAGFNVDGTNLRFGNTLRGNGVNFTISAITNTEITLSLVPGSKWRKNVDNLPGPLNLLAADAGDGYVALGPTTVKSGRNVATVYEDPTVNPSSGLLYRTHGHTLSITGTGFSTEFPPIFYFENDILTARVDYFANVVNRTAVDLMLVGKAWMASAGELKLYAIDTGAGKVTFPELVTVAHVIEDAADHESGLVVFPSNSLLMYQSSYSTPLIITGSGFKSEPTLVFNPPLTASTDYVLTVISETQLSLKLQSGKQWRPIGGPLTLESISINGEVVALGGGLGIKVATILSDPHVKEENLRIYATFSKHFTIQGSGFMSLYDPDFQPKVVLDTVSPDSFIVYSTWTDKSIKLWLNAGKEWAHLSGDDTAIIKVISIDTGAGPVLMPNGGTMVVTVHADSDETLCDDSCTYANDGQCDEPSEETGGVFGSNKGKLGYYSDDANQYSSSYSASSSYAGHSGYGGYTSDDFAFGLAACDPGTDCTDCGLKIVVNGACTNTCLKTARDGVCDDPRVGGTCASGTDCQDCGPVGASNFSKFTEGVDWDSSAYSSDTSWYTDDSSFLLDDDWVLEGQAANAMPQYKRNFQDHQSVHHEMEGSGDIFMDVLWAVVMLVGGTVSFGFCLVAYRRLKTGKPPNFVPLPHRGEDGDDFEMSRLNAADITPDVVRIG